jgi:hypothetical protein
MLWVMETRDGTKLVEILQQRYHPREEGWLWLAVRQPRDEGGVLNQIEGLTARRRASSTNAVA